MSVFSTFSARETRPAARRRVWGLLLLLVAAVAAPAGGTPAPCGSLTACECCCCADSCGSTASDRGDAPCCEIDPAPADPPRAADPAVTDGPPATPGPLALLHETAPEGVIPPAGTNIRAGSRSGSPGILLLTCSLLL